MIFIKVKVVYIITGWNISILYYFLDREWFEIFNYTNGGRFLGPYLFHRICTLEIGGLPSLDNSTFLGTIPFFPLILNGLTSSSSAEPWGSRVDAWWFGNVRFDKGKGHRGEIACCLIGKCYRRDRWREGDEGERLNIMVSFFSMVFLSTKGLSFSSCLERACFMLRGI